MTAKRSTQNCVLVFFLSTSSVCFECSVEKAESVDGSGGGVVHEIGDQINSFRNEKAE